jgi:hypothetical protein
MSERTPMDRYLDRLERCLEADLKAEKERRRYWRQRGGVEAEMRARYESARKRIQEENLRDADPSNDEPKH